MLQRAKSEPLNTRGSSRKQNQFKVKFALRAAGARQVFVCGDFNRWNGQSNPLRETAPGQWATIVSLGPGRYEYKFVVDGEWQHDPTATQSVPNQYGSFNSVIAVSDTGLG